MAESTERTIELSPSKETSTTLEKVEARKELQDKYKQAWENTLSQPGLDLIYQNLSRPLEDIRNAIFSDNQDAVSNTIRSFEEKLDAQLGTISSITPATALEHLNRTIDSLYGKQLELLSTKLEFFKSQRVVIENLHDVPDFSWKCEQYLNALTKRYTDLKKNLAKQPPSTVEEMKQAYMSIVRSMLENNSAEFKDPASWVQILSDALAHYEANEAEHTLEELQHA